MDIKQRVSINYIYDIYVKYVFPQQFMQGNTLDQPKV